MSESVKKYLLLAVAVVLTANLFTIVANSLVLSFIIIVSQLLCISKKDSAVVFMLLGSVFGAFYAQTGVRFIGSILIWGSSLFLLKDLLTYDNKWFSYFRLLWLFLILVLFSILTTTGGNYSGSKFIAMLTNVITFTIAFSHLALFSDEHSLGHIGFMFIIYSLFLLGFMNELMGIKITMNNLLYSFAGFRYDINEYLASDKKAFHINYQDIGIHGCMGLIFCLFSDDENARHFKPFIIVLSALVVWYAAARQALFLYAIIWLVYYSLYKGMSLKNIALIFLLILGGYFFLLNLDTRSLDFLTGSTEGKGSARDRIIETALSQFYANPLFGVGFGRFYIKGEYGCNEHNLFVELLTEMGIVGLLCFLFSVLMPLFRSYQYIRHNIQTIAPFLLLLLSYFLRSMVSSDLRETVVLLVLALCILMISKNQTITI